MRKLHLIILCLLSLGGLASCASQDVTPATTSNLADIQSYITTKGLSGSFTSSNLYYALTKASSSTVSPALGEELEFTYKLSVLTHSTSNTAIVVDQGVDSAYATTSIFYPFFDGSLKPGLQEGLLKMHEGETTILLMPSNLVFGTVGSPDGKVAANAPVRYDISLIRARTEDQQINEYITANKLTVDTTTANGVRVIRTMAKPTGQSVKDALAANKTVTTTYVAKQLRAKTAIGFDSTSTGLNLRNVAGYTEGIAKLRVGEKAILIFPSAMGYTSAGVMVNTTTGAIITSASTDLTNRAYKVAPYTPLLYTVEVVSAQ